MGSGCLVSPEAIGQLEFTQHFAAISASQTSPRIHVQSFRNKPDGSVTAGNASGVNDGATGVLAIGCRRNSPRRKHARTTIRWQNMVVLVRGMVLLQPWTTDVGISLLRQVCHIGRATLQSRLVSIVGIGPWTISVELW